MAMDWVFERKPKALGFLTGGLAGLVVSTPCEGYITPGGAMAVGILGGVICCSAVHLKNRLNWDDALDVWGVHGIGGLLGILLLGVLADKSVNPAGTDGLLNGNPAFLSTQALSISIATAYSFVVSWLILRVIQLASRVRTTDEEEAALDASLHGELAYEGETPALAPRTLSESAQR
jgi:ammonium transporter, Amt family